MPRARFARPSEVPVPAGAEGWEQLYPYYLVFGPHRRAHEDGAFWFRESVHWPRPLRPLEATILQQAMLALGQANHRQFVLPTAAGIDVRILHGYCYLSPLAVTDPDTVAERQALFDDRAGHYYEHWDELYAAWMARIRRLLHQLEGLSFTVLPDIAPRHEVLAGRGLGPSYDLPRALRTLLDLAAELWQYHFEFLTLGYSAYLDYFRFCRQHAPGVTDLTVARTVAGLDVDLFRPDRELRRLAHRAVELGLASTLCAEPGRSCIDALAERPGGAAWLAEFERVQHPWFQYTSGTGFYFDDPVWADHLEIPLGFIRHYVDQLLAGHPIDTSAEELAATRDRLTTDIRTAVAAERRAEFDAALGLARHVSHYVENHNFYVEHWGMAVVWRKLRELSVVFVKEGFWNAPDDLFHLRVDELAAALDDLVMAWASGVPACGPQLWPTEIARRRDILAACSRAVPPPALGLVPDHVDEPFAVMLWGITDDAVAAWLDQSAPRELHGFGASSGTVVGRARVVAGPDGLDDIEDGDILVTECTSPSWAPVFSRLAGTVTEVGGLMSHVAIVCREYGLPAVTGVPGVTHAVRTGQLLRVDGTAGTVTVLDG